MKIVGFGDSFIWKASQNTDTCYLDYTAQELGAEVEWRGYNGSGSWDAFFQFKNYPQNIDVAVFAWSGVTRLYHPNVRGICHGSSQQVFPGADNFEIWDAARKYYYYLYDWEKSEYEAMAFYQWFDQFSTNYPNTKFIHMWSFAKDTTFDESWEKYKGNPDNLEYPHRWKNGAEIRPALMHFSTQDGWPADNNLHREKRNNHLTEPYHIHLSNVLTTAIKEYQPGKLYALK